MPEETAHDEASFAVVVTGILHRDLADALHDHLTKGGIPETMTVTVLPLAPGEVVATHKATR